MDHLTDTEIQEFLAGSIPREACRRIVRHLLRGCARSEGEDKPVRLPKEGSGEPVTRLQGGWLVAEALLRLSYEARFRDPGRMRQLAIRAGMVAKDIDPEAYPPGFVYDLQARTWLELANACRVDEELNFAEVALTRAGDLLQKGAGDLLLLARAAVVRASLRQAQRRHAEASDLLEEAYRLYLNSGDLHLAGRALISRGICLRSAGEPQAAIRTLREGLSLLDRERDSQLLAIAQQALLDGMVDCGEYAAAGELLLSSGLAQVFACEPLNLLRLRWLQGKIFAGLGKLARAEKAFQEVRRGFLERGLEYDSALVGLDLASIWLRMEKAAQIRPLAHEMLETFQELGIYREAGEALRYLDEVG